MPPAFRFPLSAHAPRPRVTIDTDAYSDQILSEYRRPDISRYYPILSDISRYFPISSDIIRCCEVFSQSMTTLPPPCHHRHTQESTRRRSLLSIGAPLPLRHRLHDTQPCQCTRLVPLAPAAERVPQVARLVAVSLEVAPIRPAVLLERAISKKDKPVGGGQG